jgi:hypothetical protein
MSASTAKKRTALQDHGGLLLCAGLLAFAFYVHRARETAGR